MTSMTMSELEAAKNISIVKQGNVFVVPSFQVAQHFEKKHNVILRAIEKTLKYIPDDFHLHNFLFTAIIVDPSSNRGSKFGDTFYLLTKDGFSLLAMEFTGKKAMEWKIQYINAFNFMEKTLIEKIQNEKAIPTQPQA